MFSKNSKLNSNKQKTQTSQHPTKSLIKDLWRFVTHPKNLLPKNSTKPGSLDKINIIRLIALALIAGQLSFALVYLLLSLTSYDISSNFNLFDNTSSLFLIFVSAVIIAPITEEITFRLWLSTNQVEILTGLFFFLTSLGLVFSVFIQASLSTLALFQLGVWLFSLTIILVFKKFFSSQNGLASYWKKHFTKVTYLSTLIFGFIHLSNFNNLGWRVWLLPIITLPQLLLGLIFAYARVKYSLKVAILVHSIYNLIIIWPFLISFQTQVSFQTLTNQGYQSIFNLISFSLGMLLLGLTYIVLLFTIFYNSGKPRLTK